MSRRNLLLTAALPAPHLLLAATGVLLLTALGPLQRLPEPEAEEPRPPRADPGAPEIARAVRTVSPIAKSETSEPTEITRPTISCPGTHG